MRREPEGAQRRAAGGKPDEVELLGEEQVAEVLHDRPPVVPRPRGEHRLVHAGEELAKAVLLRVDAREEAGGGLAL